MWLIPSPSCPSVPATGDSNSPSDSLAPDHGWWLTLSGRPTQRPSSWRGWRTRSWSRRLFGMAISPTWTQACSSVSGWSPPGSPASRGVRPERDEGSTTTDGSGPQLLGSFALFDPDSCSWRTSRASLFGAGWEPFSETWPRWGSMRSGGCYRRPMLVPRNSGSGSTCWPTPDSSVFQDGESPETWLARRAMLKARHVNGNGMGTPLAMAAQMWPTPVVSTASRDLGALDPEAQRDPNRKRTVDLSSVAKVWPTPRAMDAEQRGEADGMTGTLTAGARLWHAPTAADGMSGPGEHTTRGGASNLRTEVNLWSTPAAHDAKGTGLSQMERNSLMVVEQASSLPDPRTEPDGPAPSTQPRRLNPRFVAWLMGLPVGWTDTTTPLARTSFDAWATESSRWLAHWLSVYLPKD